MKDNNYFVEIFNKSKETICENFIEEIEEKLEKAIKEEGKNYTFMDVTLIDDMVLDKLIHTLIKSNFTAFTKINKFKEPIRKEDTGEFIYKKTLYVQLNINS
ncbi:hypothetical protein IRP63_15935 (plasmid) [Clostridium botulinum]|uniref:Uncharacterized protein n=2 Tax=Clostridium botulinum TaxID=1491 RepID=A0A0A0HWT1_CLOBO|nr:hypothetical protein [Clostridium botulinum]KEH99949.1 hypothetical protein Z952_14585 [Clostridium botulinum C/D str. BKT75002]KGM93017.1 hypothetical protein Z955_16325 [Clostridium botulinum C/D str. DC5]KOC51940.1 hypothetical protein ADU90_15000 [Clostridium botulinum]KOC56613.1 hypothetical protein ADU89_02490 [Clostridium botulinum]MCD3235310.1 hypothetical protein [Clostridium botulinum D/C]